MGASGVERGRVGRVTLESGGNAWKRDTGRPQTVPHLVSVLFRPALCTKVLRGIVGGALHLL